MSHLWKLMFSLGYHGSIPYDTDHVETTSDHVELQPLDPIHVAGALSHRTQMIMKSRSLVLGLTVLTTALLFISDPLVCATYLVEEQPKQREVHYSSARYTDHIGLLESWGVLDEVELEFATFISGYFETTKGKVSRAIFNGKKVSKLFRPPPAVNIPDIPAFIQKLDAFVRQHRRAHVCSGDLRHCFHQVETNALLRKKFCIALETKSLDKGERTIHQNDLRVRKKRSRPRVFSWQTLPMGFSYSPWVAQSLAWTLLSWRNPNQAPMLDESAFKNIDGHLPTFVDLIDKSGRAIGFCCIYYDNYFAVFNDGEACKAFSKRLKANAIELGIHIKGESEADRAAGIEPSHIVVHNQEMHSTGTIYLGILFTVIATTSSVNGVTVTSASIRWKLGKVEKWKIIHSGPDTLTEGKTIQCPLTRPTTYRQAAELTGRIMFWWILHCKRVSSQAGARDLIEVIRRTSHGAFARNNWNHSYNMSDADFTTLQMQWIVVATNEWLHGSAETIPSPDDPILATDASSYGFGYVMFPSAGEVPRATDFSWKGTDLQGQHIFILEAHAALAGIDSFFTAHPGAPRLTLVCDNTGVVGSLRNGFCTNEKVMNMILDCPHLDKVHVVSCISDHNAADCPSRVLDPKHSKNPYADFPERCRHTLRAVAKSMKGRKYGKEKAFDGPSSNSLRHDAPDDDAVYPQNDETEMCFLHSDHIVEGL